MGGFGALGEGGKSARPKERKKASEHTEERCSTLGSSAECVSGEWRKGEITGRPGGRGRSEKGKGCASRTGGGAYLVVEKAQAARQKKGVVEGEEKKLRCPECPLKRDTSQKKVEERRDPTEGGIRNEDESSS